MKYRIPILRGMTILLFFLITAGIISYCMKNLWYIVLFGGIGLVSGVTEFAIAGNPKKSQIIRKTVHYSLGSTLVILAIIIGINFQFSQVCFDVYSGIITGALIQMILARLLLPILLGNIFCSRACWDGAVFDFADLSKNSKTNDSKLSAWMVMALIILVTFIISLHYIPKAGTDSMRNIFIIENAGIIILGLAISCFKGKRFYCRNLCPFIAVSGLISRFSLFKISPKNERKCIECEECNRNCPMGIDVMNYIKNQKCINHPNCILCEKCVSQCKSGCISLDISRFK